MSDELSNGDVLYEQIKNLPIRVPSDCKYEDFCSSTFGLTEAFKFGQE